MSFWFAQHGLTAVFSNKFVARKRPLASRANNSLPYRKSYLVVAMHRGKSHKPMQSFRKRLLRWHWDVIGAMTILWFVALLQLIALYIRE
ncbi:hypothetical protein [Pseudosulfitobacter pseudonitzschiae]|uniref:hypothetical protein n=1 Tax=Pseudosulfitobacter pseudonitzschiae TaxID=1402135 RepID=UPI001BB513E2|nr:hypothetical protein [Pseudosulfitobacter pseudonitzschiae]MBM1849818.1 hypothetical protein [Pseudosulfitobacter pseudonitzschiae]MBM1854650.1 hypothetical protein [Pseudosulfitobacter pseudonitzschiae]MBM1908002.1 hypothetical protein [Pseudosulfitobacter pseudonitzschiae]MBM1937010.1 hypothetical protein [Pseudosulfitobacter pseudonitzschiae]MBM1946712.1 hypothetical protein [Pseudosulfitobacter pseudonitzschiae]